MNGLVLAGGHSTRMGRTKALIPQSGDTWLTRTAQLLAPYCERVWVSCRVEQQAELSAAPWHGPWIFDHPEWTHTGPMNGLLSATKAQGGDWWVLACDYPLLTADDMTFMWEQARPDALATVFRNQEGFLEALLGIYRAPALPLLEDWVKKGHFSLQHFCRTHEVQVLDAPFPERLQNVNSA